MLWPRQLLAEVPHLRTILLGRSLGTLGESLQMVGLLWLAATAPNPGLNAAIAGLAIAAPAVVLGPLIGPFVDRLDRARLLSASDAGSAALAPLIAVGYLVGGVPLASVIAGLAWTLRALAMSAFTAMFPDKVGQAHLVRANGLNVSLTNAALSIGALGAGLMATASALLPFGAATALYCLSAVAWLHLSARRTTTAQSAAAREPYRQALRAGYDFTRTDTGVRWLLAVGVIATIGFAPSAAALPVLVEHEVGGGAFQYGVVLVAVTLGLVSGAVLTSRYGSSLDRPILLGTALLLMALLTAALGAAPAIGLAVVVAFARGAANSAVTTANVSLAQELVPSEVRGRVMAFRTAVQEAPRLAVLPVAGVLIELAGARATFFAMAVTTAIAGVVALNRRGSLRRRAPIPAAV